MSTSARKDIEFLVESRNKTEGARKVNVAAGATLIYPGDIVACAPGTIVGSLMATNKPVAGSDYLMGIAVSTSTNTGSLAGTVLVVPMDPLDVLLISPNDPTAWDTQAEYDALVNKRVLIDLTAVKYTILASDNSTYGCVIQPLDISKYPGKVAFCFRAGCSYLV